MGGNVSQFQHGCSISGTKFPAVQRQLQINQEADGCYQKQDQPRKQKLQFSFSLCTNVALCQRSLQPFADSQSRDSRLSIAEVSEKQINRELYGKVGLSGCGY